MQGYNDEIALKEILIKLSEYKLFCLKRKYTIIVCALLFGVLGVFFALYSHKEYNAELTFTVESEQSGGAFGAMSGIASQFGFDIGASSGSGTFSQSNVIELLKSRHAIHNTLMQNIKVNGKIDLAIEHYLDINKIRDDWNSADLNGISFEDYYHSSYIHDSIIGIVWQEIVENGLIVELQSDDATILTLSYASVNEEFSKEFVKTLINEMSKMYISHQTSQANRTLDFLQNRADSVFSELKIVEQEFAKVKDVNQRIIKATGRLKELQLMRRVEVLNTMYLEIIKNLELSKITLLNNTPIINIIDEPVLPLEDNSMSEVLAFLFGGFLGGFLSVVYFIFRKLFADVLMES